MRIDEQNYEYTDDGQYVTDIATGERIKTVTITTVQGSRIITPQQKKTFEKQRQLDAAKSYSKSANGPLGKFFFVFGDERFCGLSPETITRLIFLNTYLEYGTHRLMLDRKTPIKRKDIPALLGVSKATASSFWQEAHPLYITEDSDGGLLSNKDIFARGRLTKRQNREGHQRLFNRGVRKLYKATNPSKHKHLGYIFSLLPYINLEYNIICKNPYCKEIEDIEPITLSDFCRLIGYNEKNLYRIKQIYNSLLFDVLGEKQKFCVFVNDGVTTDNSFIYVNPNILYAGSNYHKVELLTVSFR